MDLGTMLAAIPLPPAAERWIAYVSIGLAVATVIARGLDWASPRLSAAAVRMAIAAAVTPGDLDDRAARVLAAFARLLAQVAVVLAGIVDALRAVLPRASVSISGRSDPGRPMSSGSGSLLAVVLVVVGLSALDGCGPSVSTVRDQYVSTANRCIEDVRQLEAECPAGEECIGRLHVIRERCDRELAAICDQGRRARRVCE